MLAVFLDIETTGLDLKKHHAIDIAFQLVDLNKKKKGKFYQSIIRQSADMWEAMDQKSAKIHGLQFKDLNQGKEAAAVSEEIQKIFSEYEIVRSQAVFICQNPAFDRSFFSKLIDISIQESLQWPYHWLDLASMYFALTLQSSIQKELPFPEQFLLSKNNIAEAFKLPPEEIPHTATSGVHHLIDCYQALFGIHFE